MAHLGSMLRFHIFPAILAQTKLVPVCVCVCGCGCVKNLYFVFTSHHWDPLTEYLLLFYFYVVYLVMAPSDPTHTQQRDHRPLLFQSFVCPVLTLGWTRATCEPWALESSAQTMAAIHQRGECGIQRKWRQFFFLNILMYFTPSPFFKLNHGTLCARSSKCTISTTSFSH